MPDDREQREIEAVARAICLATCLEGDCLERGACCARGVSLRLNKAFIESRWAIAALDRIRAEKKDD